MTRLTARNTEGVLKAEGIPVREKGVVPILRCNDVLPESLFAGKRYAYMLR